MPDVTPPPAERQTYTEEFRRAAVDLLAAEGLTVAAAARRPGVNPEVPRKWKRRHAPVAAAGAGGPPDRADAPDLAAEVRRLREQVRQLTRDRDIPEEAATFSARESARGSVSSASPRPPGPSRRCAATRA